MLAVPAYFTGQKRNVRMCVKCGGAGMWERISVKCWKQCGWFPAFYTW